MRNHPTLLLAAAVLALLAACGGGGTGSSGGAAPSRASIQSVGANSAVLPNDSTEAVSTALTAAQAVAAAGSASATVGVTVACAGGGTATYTVAGTNNPLQWLNRALDVGETYVISFTDCQSSGTAAPVNGSMTLTATATGATLAVDTRTTNLRVTLPLRTVTFNGNSTITQTVAGSGNNTSTTTRWTSPAIQVRSQRSSGPSTLFNLSGVNYARTIGAVNGIPVNSSEGTSSMRADLALFTWFITLATLGPVLYDTTGVLVQGSWLIDLPDDRITVSISSQRVSFQFDLGANGTIDLSFTIDLDAFLADAA
jgi:hypothetical protein